MSQVLKDSLCHVCRFQDLESRHMSSWTTERPLGRWQISHIFSSRQSCALCEFLFEVMSLDGRLSQYRESWDSWQDTGELFLYIRSHDGESGCRLNIQVEFEDLVDSVPCDGTLILTKPFYNQHPTVFYQAPYPT